VLDGTLHRFAAPPPPPLPPPLPRTRERAGASVRRRCSHRAQHLPAVQMIRVIPLRRWVDDECGFGDPRELIASPGLYGTVQDGREHDTVGRCVAGLDDVLLRDDDVRAAPYDTSRAFGSCVASGRIFSGVRLDVIVRPASDARRTRIGVRRRLDGSRDRRLRTKVGSKCPGSRERSGFEPDRRARRFCPSCIGFAQS